MAIRSGWFGVFADQLGCEADCDNFFVAIVVYHARCLYGYLERSYGSVDDLDSAGRKNELRWGNWELFGDFSDKLPCQLSGT